MSLSEKYKKEVIPAMKQKFGYRNVNAAPKITKVAVNVGIGRYLKDEKAIKQIEDDLKLITGQKPEPRRSKKSIAGFKIREGMTIGFRVTLRRKRMSDFLEKLIGIALPRSRDFRGLDLKSIDQSGNLNIGVKEQIIFAEAMNAKMIFGFEITVVVNARKREEAVELYRLLGFPIKPEIRK